MQPTIALKVVCQVQCAGHDCATKSQCLVPPEALSRGAIHTGMVEGLRGWIVKSDGTLYCGERCRAGSVNAFRDSPTDYRTL